MTKGQRTKQGSSLQLILFCTKARHALSQEWMYFWLLSLKKDFRVWDGHQKCEKEELILKEKLDMLRLLHLYRIVWGDYNQDYRITRIIPELGGILWSCWGQIQQFHLQNTAASGWGCGILLYCTFCCHHRKQSLGLEGPFVWRSLVLCYKHNSSKIMFH